MKNDLQNLTEDISRLYEDITQKTESLGQMNGIARLYDELQFQLQGISTEEVDLLLTDARIGLGIPAEISAQASARGTIEQKLAYTDFFGVYGQVSLVPAKPGTLRASVAAYDLLCEA